MQTYKSIIITHASAGRLTLQVPEFILGTPNDPLINYPDDYFIYLNGDKPCYGKQEGCLYLSEKGYNYFKSDLQQAFINHRGHTWQDFENHAQDHFKKVKLAHKKLITKLQKSLKEVKSIKL